MIVLFSYFINYETFQTSKKISPLSRSLKLLLSFCHSIKPFQDSTRSNALPDGFQASTKYVYSSKDDAISRYSIRVPVYSFAACIS